MTSDHCEMRSMGEVRERLHRKANSYFAFEARRWNRAALRLFFGATDALLDSQLALKEVSRGTPLDRHHIILSCYGYLQALYIQQDAVALIWKALDLPGDPLADPKVQRVRELRNRIAGHPARADKRMRSGKSPSSAIINLHDINPHTGFKATLYHDDEIDVINVSFQELLADNCGGLTTSLMEAEQAMDEREQRFRATERLQPLSAKLDAEITYILEKLRCGLGDSRRDMAIRMLDRCVDETQRLLTERNFLYDASIYHIDAIRAGLKIGERLHEVVEADDAEHTWWVVSEGIDSHARSLLRHLQAIDEKLAESPG